MDRVNQKQYQNKLHYDALDGMRAVACLGIILMHVNANGAYELSGFVFERFIPSLTWFVYLFMMISGFGMCAGYLEKFHQGNVNLESFYKKRYGKILPFFGFLLMIALVMEHNMTAVYEASIELLLLHGLLPNNLMSLLGVCWTLGVIFVFYLLFPAFSLLLKNRKRAWAGMILSLWVTFTCQRYFFTERFVTANFQPRQSFIYCMPMFVAGGLLYIYRDDIRKLADALKIGFLPLAILASVLWYLIPGDAGFIFYLKNLIVFAIWVMYAITGKGRLLGSRAMKFLAAISMEMYLAQMIIFRVVQKADLLYLFGKSGIGGMLSLGVAFLITVIGLILFIKIYQIACKRVKRKCRTGH